MFYKYQNKDFKTQLLLAAFVYNVDCTCYINFLLLNSELLLCTRPLQSWWNIIPCGRHYIFNLFSICSIQSKLGVNILQRGGLASWTCIESFDRKQQEYRFSRIFEIFVVDLSLGVFHFHFSKRVKQKSFHF